MSLVASAAGGCDIGAENLGTMLGIGDGNPPVENAPAPPPPPPATPVPTPKPVPKAPPGALKRNIAFDVLRSRGISRVYEGKTKDAVPIFQSAQRMKPQDKSVKLWLDAIKKASELKRLKATEGGSDFKNANGQIQNNAPPVLAPPRIESTPTPVDPSLVF